MKAEKKNIISGYRRKLTKKIEAYPSEVSAADTIFQTYLDGNGLGKI